jgi:UDP-N-acetyl-D-galactosamine dehydrogenase
MEVKIGVVGLGYVGLPLAVHLAEHFDVTGFDINLNRVKSLQNGVDFTNEVGSEALASSDLKITHQLNEIASCNFYIVTVPTPTDQANVPDLGPVIKASESVASVLKKGDIVVYESTVYPGVTEETCVPILEAFSTGLKHLVDFNVGYSPERINPGDRINTLATVMKIVSGDTAESLDIIANVYAKVVDAGIYRAPTIKVAEAAKVIENTQRDVNIALMNELSELFNRIGIDTHEVLKAAGSKYNFLKFSPGLVGGHCIGVDPYYLTHKAEIHGYKSNLILMSRQINNSMPRFIAQQTIHSMVSSNLLNSDSRVLVLGVTFKENVPDVRNSKVFDLIKLLEEYQISVDLADPYADEEETALEYNVKLSKHLENGTYDCVILAVAHDEYVLGSWAMTSGYLKPGKGLVMDIKAFLPPEQKPAHINLWRP